MVVRLPDYLQNAILPMMLSHPSGPQMPPPGHKSHKNSLSTRPERYRLLETVSQLDREKLIEKLRLWSRNTIHYSEALTKKNAKGSSPSFHRLSVPCSEAPDRFNMIPEYFPDAAPLDIAEITPLLRTLPLTTVTHIMHLIRPETQDWEFRFVPGDQDKDKFLYYLWTHPKLGDAPPSEEDSRRSVVVAYQPPWILSDKDMDEFARVKAFPAFIAPRHAFTTPLKSSERVWAKLWDTCVRNGTHHFVLTSYNRWVFGRFSPGYTIGYTTPPFEYSSSEPTIVELLTYWVAMALTPDSKYGICKQEAEPHHPQASLLLPSPKDVEVEDFTMSESDWDGKNDEAGSSAGVAHCAVSDTGIHDTITTPLHRQTAQRGKATKEYAERWLASIREETGKENKPLDDLCPQTLTGPSNAAAGPSAAITGAGVFFGAAPGILAPRKDSFGGQWVGLAG